MALLVQRGRHCLVQRTAVGLLQPLLSISPRVSFLLRRRCEAKRQRAIKILVMIELLMVIRGAARALRHGWPIGRKIAKSLSHRKDLPLTCENVVKNTKIKTPHTPRAPTKAPHKLAT